MRLTTVGFLVRNRRAGCQGDRRAQHPELLGRGQALARPARAALLAARSPSSQRLALSQDGRWFSVAQGLRPRRGVPPRHAPSPQIPRARARPAGPPRARPALAPRMLQLLLPRAPLNSAPRFTERPPSRRSRPPSTTAASKSSASRCGNAPLASSATHSAGGGLCARALARASGRDSRPPRPAPCPRPHHRASLRLGCFRTRSP